MNGITKRHKLLLIAGLVMASIVGVVSAADGTMTDMEVLSMTLITLLPMIGTGMYSGYMYYVRARQGESFEWEKAAPTIGIGLVLSIGFYFTGITAVTVDTMTTLIGPYAPLGVSGLFGAIYGVFDQYQKGTATRKAEAVVAVTASGGVVPQPQSTTTGAVPNQPIGEVTIDGIYLHDAFHSPPAPRAVIDTNLVPAVTIWFELTGTKTGVVMLKVAVDDKVLKSWMPDTSYPDGARATNVTGVGDRMPFGFRYPGNQKVKGEHRIKVFAGYATGKEPVFTQSAEFILELKGDIVE